MDIIKAGDQLFSYNANGHKVTFVAVSLQGDQVIVKAVDSNLSVGEEGHALMVAEGFLRVAYNRPYEVYLEARKDENKLRLQTLEKIADHKRRQEELKNAPR